MGRRLCTLILNCNVLERIKEQPRALCHAPLTNIQKSPRRIFATFIFVRSFSDYLLLQLFI